MSAKYQRRGCCFFIVLAMWAWSITGAAVFPGNGNSGFGGPVGQGNLVITSDDTNLYFTLIRGPFPLNDYLVLYLDTLPGGHAHTLNFFDDADNNRRAISGFDGINQAQIFFPSGGEPDRGISFSAADGAFLYGLQSGGVNAHWFFAAGGGADSNSAPSFSWSFPLATLGLSPGDSFRFYGTLINGANAFRSDEAIGPGIAPGNPGIPSGIAFLDPLTFTLSGTPFDVINYQGRLVISNELANGIHTIEFHLYDAETGGTALYGETQTVAVVDGLYAVQMGEEAPVDNPLALAIAQYPAFLEVVVDGQPLSPREPLSAVPYAMLSAGVMKDGITAAMIQNGAVTSGKLGSFSVTADKIAVNAVGSSAIFPGAVTSSKIALSAVTVSHIASGAVTTVSIANNAVTGSKILDGSITIQDVASNTFWTTVGNADMVAGTHFLGTTDNRPVEIRANNQRALLITPSNGSPNIILGSQQNVISNGTLGASILGGSNNTIGVNSQFATISGGLNNNIGVNANQSVIGGGLINNIGANANQSVIAGGVMNDIFTSAPYSFIGGGFNNNIGTNANQSVIAGGFDNNIGMNATRSVIGGGEKNDIFAGSFLSFIGGGFNNNIGVAHHGVIGGGRDNDITNSPYSVIGGGQHHQIVGSDNVVVAGGRSNRVINATGSAIAGGEANFINKSFFSTIGGGSNNYINTSSNGVVAGGRNNRLLENNDFSVIGGGENNTHYIESRSGTIGGGRQNAITDNADAATIGGGESNEAREDYATVGGGYANSANHNGSTVSGGYMNNAQAYRSVIGGGTMNEALGPHAVISGGATNRIDTTSTNGVIGGGSMNSIELESGSVVIAGGKNNRALHYNDYSVIGGGRFNTLYIGARFGTIGGGELNQINDFAEAATIAGGSQNAVNNSRAAVGGGLGNQANGEGSTIGGGTMNQADGAYATIPGGENNLANGNYSFAAGRRARVNHAGSFVWADDTNADFGSSAARQFLVRASGGIGFNTTNTSLARMTVNGATLGNVGLFGDTHPVSLQQSYPIVGFNQYYSGAGGVNRIHTGGVGGGGGTNYSGLVGLDPYNGRLIFETSSGSTNSHVNITRFERMTILQNGNVGIGTTSPTNRLHVVGTVQATAYITGSDRAAKENITPVSSEEVLAKVAALPISTWRFKGQTDGMHMGPMAQDFHAAFGLGNTESGIYTVDADGVALAAIQALAKEKTEIRDQMSDVREEVSVFGVRVSELEEENARLKEELEAIKRKLGM